MKKLLVLCLLISGAAFGQVDGEQLVTVKKKFVSQAGVAEATTAEKTAVVAGYVGLGKEVGTAMKEGLTALTDETDRFSKTKPGQFVMTIIAFKVIGRPLMGFVVGLILLIIGFPIWSISYRKNCFDTKYLWKEKLNQDGKVESREYAMKDRNADSGEHFVYFIVLLIWVGVCSLVMFA